MEQKKIDAPDVVAHIVRVADRYTSQWRHSTDEHFCRAARTVDRFVASIREKSEADPEGFLREWTCVMTIPDIAAMRKILEAAKEGKGNG